MKEVQPHDATAEKMFNSVFMKSLSQKVNIMASYEWIQKVVELPWANMLRISPLILGSLMILIGLSNAANRNFAGGGVALLALVLGFTFVKKGRVHPHDFWHQK